MSLSLPLADRYLRFRDSVFNGMEDPSDLPGINACYSELDWQSLWFAGALGKTFQSTDGQVITVTDFGFWNAGPGPDFRSCVIQCAGQTLCGDIELDTDARDWEHHGHGVNADYDQVILHLVLRSPQQCFFTRNRFHQAIPQVVLRPEMLAESAVPCRGMAVARLGRCARPLSEMGEGKVQSIIESAAQLRLENKSRCLHRAAVAHGREQAVFQALARTLGYRNNSQPFFILSQRLPVRRLLQCDALEREALLFGASGFLKKIRIEDTHSQTRAYLRDLWSVWWRHRDACSRWFEPSQNVRWNLAATRPGNHPQRRLGALVAMLQNWRSVCGPLEDATRWSQSAWCATLAGLRHHHWSTHYTLTAPPSSKPLALVGETRVHEMLANVAYPLLVPERTRLWAEYLDLPALLDNQKIRLATLRLFGRGNPLADKFQAKLYHHQGLLQIYEDFCLEDESGCVACMFPERLKEWS